MVHSGIVHVVGLLQQCPLEYLGPNTGNLSPGVWLDEPKYINHRNVGFYGLFVWSFPGCMDCEESRSVQNLICMNRIEGCRL